MVPQIGDFTFLFLVSRNFIPITRIFKQVNIAFLSKANDVPCCYVVPPTTPRGVRVTPPGRVT